MSKHLIFPMAFYVFYIWCLAIYMFRTRVRAVKSGEVSPRYFKTYIGDSPAERTVLVGRHYDNQFQTPVLYFATCTVHMVMGSTNSTTLALAWFFVIFRLLHSWVHLGSNVLQKRVMWFAAAWAMIVVLWLQLVYFAIFPIH